MRTPHKGPRLVACLALSVLLFTSGRAVGQSNQPSQLEIARTLLGNDSTQRREALATVRRLKPENVGPDLRSALFKLLYAHNRAAREAVAQGLTVDQRLDPEFHSRVTETVAGLGDPQAIPVLVNSLGTGYVIHRTLAAFGEAAAPGIVGIVMSPQSGYEAINEGLIALRFMVESAKRRPLSAASMQGIRAAAIHHLSQSGRPVGTGVTLRWAVDLAIVLGDADLRRIVETIAADPEELIARGITEPELVASTQQWAADRLMGVPPRPRD